MKCKVCGKEFEGRSGAKCCSSTCRSRASRATDNPISVAVVDKPSWLCKIKGCYLEKAPGHNDQCIYHWRISEGLSHIPKERYDKLNQEMSGSVCLTV